mgnify:CR=1 FL=1
MNKVTHMSLFDARVRQEEIFQLSRVDVFSSSNYHVFYSSFDLTVAKFIQNR